MESNRNKTMLTEKQLEIRQRIEKKVDGAKNDAGRQAVERSFLFDAAEGTAGRTLLDDAFQHKFIDEWEKSFMESNRNKTMLTEKQLAISLRIENSAKSGIEKDKWKAASGSTASGSRKRNFDDSSSTAEPSTKVQKLEFMSENSPKPSNFLYTGMGQLRSGRPPS